MDLRETSLGFYRAWFIATGLRNGLLSSAARAPAGELDPEMVARYYRGAHALGLVERASAGRWRLKAEHAKTLGDAGDPEYLGHHFEYLTRKSLTFGALDDLLRGERLDVDMSGVYALATSWDHVAFFEKVLPRERATLKLLRDGCDVLDLGAGLGAWSREAARRFPKTRVTAAETKDALPKLRGALSGTRVESRAIEKLDAASFDVVFLGEVLSAAGDPLAPLRTARRALRPGGWMHALEGLRSEGEPRGWGERLVLAMDLDFALDGSRFLSVREAERALAAAKFEARRVRDVGGSLFHVRGRKAKGGRR